MGNNHCCQPKEANCELLDGEAQPEKNKQTCCFQSCTIGNKEPKSSGCDQQQQFQMDMYFTHSDTSNPNDLSGVDKSVVEIPRNSYTV